jgi:hypothetical protein
MRSQTSRRSAILTALTELFSRLIDGSGTYRSQVRSVSPRLLFWDEIQEFPAIHMNAGSESRVYQAGGMKDRYLSATIRCYVNEENSIDALEALLEDVESVIDDNGRLAYLDSTGATQFTRDIVIIDISTDEGVLDPIGVGEILIQVKY